MKAHLQIMFLAAIAALSAVAAPASARPERPQRIATTRFSPGHESQIWVSGANGVGRPITGTADFRDALDPAFSPDGRLIAFTAITAATGDQHIYTIRPDGSGIHQVTSGDGFAPAFSANGRNIFYTSLVGRRIAILRVPVGGGTPKVLIRGVGSAGAFEPAASPNGRILAFVSAGIVYTARVDGSHIRRLAGGRDPSFSPDGRWVLYSRRTGHRSKLFLRRPSGGPVRTLFTANPTGIIVYPSFSPSGQSVIFQRSALARNVMAISTRGAPRLRRLFPAEADGFYYSSPAWQPR